MSAALPQLGFVRKPVVAAQKRGLFLPFFAILPSPEGSLRATTPSPPSMAQQALVSVPRRSHLALPIPGNQAPVLSAEGGEGASIGAPTPASAENFIEKAVSRIERELGPAVPRRATLRLCAQGADAATTPFGSVVLEIVDQMQGNTPLREIRLRVEGTQPNAVQEKRLTALVSSLGGRRQIPTNERGVALFHGPIPVRPAGLPVGTRAGR